MLDRDKLVTVAAWMDPETPAPIAAVVGWVAVEHGGTHPDLTRMDFAALLRIRLRGTAPGGSTGCFRSSRK